MTIQPEHFDVIVIGGGIIGSALAWELSKAGVGTLLLERNQIGGEASWASGGIISAPGPRYGAIADLALESFHGFPAWVEEIVSTSGIDVGYVRTGQYDLIPPGGMAAAREILAWQHNQHMESELLDYRTLRQREPAVHGEFDGAIFNPGAGSLRFAKLCEALARAGEQRGLTVREHQVVTSIDHHGGVAQGVTTATGRFRADQVVVCAGAWSRMLGNSIDFNIPTTPVRGQMLGLADPPVPLRAVVAGAGGYIIPRADGTIAIGATEEHDSGFSNDVTPAGLEQLIALLHTVAPSLLRARFDSTWAGLRPGSQDGLPIMGRLPHLPNVWVSTGHFRAGALLSLSSARSIRDSILSGNSHPILTPFDPARLN